jgi:hypothetical protein
VTTTSCELIGLARLPSEIKALTGATLSYRDAYAAVVDGIIPARHLRGRWYVDRHDLATVAGALGLKLRS